MKRLAVLCDSLRCCCWLPSAPVWAQPAGDAQPLGVVVAVASTAAGARRPAGPMGQPAARTPAGARTWRLALALDDAPEQRSSARTLPGVAASLPPQQRATMRRRWQQFQRLTPEQRQQIRQNLNAFARLPPEQRLQLRQRWLNATPVERQQMLQNLRQRPTRQQRLQAAPPGFRGGVRLPRGPR